MKQLFVTVLLAFFAITDLLAQAGSGVYVGGHIRRERPNTIKKLKIPVLIPRQRLRSLLAVIRSSLQ